MKATLMNPMGDVVRIFEYGDDETRVGSFEIRCSLFDGSWSIWAVEIYPPYRGLGHGRTLMNLALAELRHRGAKTAHLWVRSENAVAIKLYESLGFKITMQYAAPRSVLRMEVIL